MLELLAALAICGGTALALRGGFAMSELPKLNPKALILAALSIAVSVLLFGWVFGLMIIVAVVIHEMGHVLAYRVAGHTDARFRLIPLFGGVAISNRAPRTHTDEVFVTLMGPAIGLAPMVLAFALSVVIRSEAPMTSTLLAAFGMATGALNAFNLMPFYPLDGGRILRLATASLFPAAELLIAGAMVALLLLLAIIAKSILIGVIALIGLQALRVDHARKARAIPMKKATALVALAAYATTLAAFVVGGLPLIRAIV